MFVVHAISGTKKGGRPSRRARGVLLAIERRHFSTAAASSEGLIPCGPALTEQAIGKNKDIEVHSRNQVPRSSIHPMKSKHLRFLLAIAVTFTFSAWAQTGSAATPSGPTAAPANPAPSAPTTTAGPSTGTKVGTINITEAIFGSNEGRRDLEAWQKKIDPKQNELKSQNDELDGLKKQLSTTQDKLNEDALATLKKQIETKQKSFDRAYQDFQEEAGNQQQEIATRVLQKMAPMIVKYSEDNGFGMIVDTSKPWPQSNVLWWGQAVDITKAIVDAYNLQSGVPAPTRPATKPTATTGTKPAAPAGGTKPATTTAPPK